MVSKMEKCPHCNKFFLSQSEKNEILIFKKMDAVLKSHKSLYEKKIALYNCLKKMEVGELQPIEKERINFLLQSKLYGELAKQSMREYEKLTIEDYSNRR